MRSILMFSKPASRNDAISLFGLRRAMVAAQRFEQAIIPGLHPETYPRNACRAKQPRLFQRHGCRVCLEGPLAKRAQIQSAAQFSQEIVQLIDRQCAGRAASEVDRVRLKLICLLRKLHFPQERIQKLPSLVLRASLYIEAAVWAELLAERDMKVEMANRRGHGEGRRGKSGSAFVAEDFDVQAIAKAVTAAAGRCPRAFRRARGSCRHPRPEA